MPLVDRLREFARLAQVGSGGLEPEHVGIRRVRKRPCDRRLEAVLNLEESLGGPRARAERRVHFVDVGRQQRGAQRVGTRDQQRRHVENVGGEPCGAERANELRRRHEHLAAEMAALLLSCELVLEVHAGGAGLDHRPHQLVGVERPAEAGLGIRDDRCQPLGAAAAFRPLDLIRAQERVRQATHDLRHRVRGIQALVGVRRARQVGVGGDLPPREIDRLQPGPHHLHGLPARERPKRIHVAALCFQRRCEEAPEPLGPELRERAFRHHRSAEPHHLLGAVAAPDSGPAFVLRPLPFQLFRALLDPKIGVHRHS
jgi:hypothetical protein